MPVFSFCQIPAIFFGILLVDFGLHVLGWEFFFRQGPPRCWGARTSPPHVRVPNGAAAALPRLIGVQHPTEDDVLHAARAGPAADWLDIIGKNAESQNWLKIGRSGQVRSVDPKKKTWSKLNDPPPPIVRTGSLTRIALACAGVSPHTLQVAGIIVLSATLHLGGGWGSMLGREGLCIWGKV